MDTVAYQSLPGEDIAYPNDRYHAYLKLFSHSWNFGRVDLGVLLIEWILYLIFTAFIAVKSAHLVKWDFVYISTPLYVAVLLGCLRTGFCGKRSRCGLGSRAFFGAATIVTYVLLILRLESAIKWSWHLVFAPTYIVLGVLLVVIAAYWFWALCSINGDGLFKGFLFIMWTSFPLAIGSIYLLAGKLNGATKISWWFVFAPAFAFHAFLLLTTPIFVVRFPDQAFILDRVGPSYGKSIKPRYRVNIIFLTAAILNIPVALFSALLCVHMEYNRVPWPAVFSPLFIAEIFALGLLFCLISARRKRGTYCVRVDGGPGVETKEIW